MATSKKTSTSKSTKKSGLDLGKIKDIIDDNPEAVEKIKDGVVDLIGSKFLGSKTTKKTSAKKTTGKKTTSKKSDSGISIMDIAGSFLKRK